MGVRDLLCWGMGMGIAMAWDWWRCVDDTPGCREHGGLFDASMGIDLVWVLSTSSNKSELNAPLIRRLEVRKVQTQSNM